MWWEGLTLHNPSDAVDAFEKIVFGTGEASESLGAVLAPYEAILDACQVPEARCREIYGGTLARVLGMPMRSEAR